MPLAEGLRPSVAFVVVADYVAPDGRAWGHERRMLRALAAQEAGTPFEVIVVEHSRLHGHIPAGVREILPAARWQFTEPVHSGLMKDAGTAVTDAEWVAVFEMDCVPAPGWLSGVLAAAKAHPEASVITGPVRYPGKTSFERACSVLHRGALSRGRDGPTRRFASSGALFRRDVALEYPHLPAATPFLAARERRRRMLRDGHQFWFTRAAETIHAFDGLRFVLDLHRNVGYADMHTLGAGRPGIGTIPRAARRRLREELRSIWTARGELRPFDWPLVVALLLAARIAEAPGWADALRGRAAPAATNYR